jgi:hypothetical protein
MTQGELENLHARIASLMDHTMALHKDGVARRSRQAGLWRTVAFALIVMSSGAAWAIGCVLLVRALL